MRRISKKAIAITTGALIVIAGTGVAYAYWTTGGGGIGSAVTGTNADIVVNQTSVITPMGPGDTPQALNGDFTNATDNSVYVTTVTVSIGSVAGATDNALGCSADDYTLVNPEMTVNAEVPVGAVVNTIRQATGAWSGATIQFNDTGANQDDCKGATVNLTYVIGALG